MCAAEEDGLKLRHGGLEGQREALQLNPEARELGRLLSDGHSAQPSSQQPTGLSLSSGPAPPGSGEGGQWSRFLASTHAFLCVTASHSVGTTWPHSESTAQCTQPGHSRVSVTSGYSDWFREGHMTSVRPVGVSLRSSVQSSLAS